LWCRLQDRFSNRRRRADDVLAAIEHDQATFVAQPCGQSQHRVDARQGDAQRGAECTRHQIGLGQRGERDEPDAIPIGRAHGFGDCNRHRGFADPTWTDDGQKTAPGQLRRQSGDDVVPADDARKRRWQIAADGRSVRRGGCRLSLLARHGCHEASPGGLLAMYRFPARPSPSALRSAAT
jgi:hypothetical protein